METKPRKTFSVAKMLKKVNFFLEHSEPTKLGERNALHSLMGSILHETGNYKGFCYLDITHNSTGVSPIINDESRKFFYISDTLKEDYLNIELDEKP